MNRQQRRQQEKASRKTNHANALVAQTKMGKIKQIAKEYIDEQVREQIHDRCNLYFAAIAETLHDECGYGAVRIGRVLHGVDKRVRPWLLGDIELKDYIKEVYEKTGVEIEPGY